MWSGPRNLSTAMMRSFGSRHDMVVMDEPFFAPFLVASGALHPGREETIDSHETDPDVIASLCATEPAHGHVFQKHMPHHMIAEFPMDWTEGAKHFFLIREPARVIASYVKGRQSFTLNDLGYGPQLKLWERLGRPPVIDSTDILKDPKSQLRKLCAAIDLPWDAAMLSWKSGPRPTDGAWAPYWYHSVENSTSFTSPPSAHSIVPEDYAGMLVACEADYAALKAAVI